MKNYKLGISIKGLIFVALVMIPNVMFVFWTPPNNLLNDNNASFWLWNVLENIGRFGSIAVLVFIQPRNHNKVTWYRSIRTTAFFFLTIYYVLWAFYFTGITNAWMILGLAIAPIIYFICCALWLYNFIALVPIVIFGIMHITITASNYLFL